MSSWIDRLDPLAQAVAHLGLGGHHGHHVDGAFEHGLAGRVRDGGQGGGAVEVAQHLGDAGPGLLEQFLLLGPGVAAEEVTVEADVDVVLGHLDAVVPQAVADGGEPAGLQFVGPPELVEGSVDEDDACHGATSSRTGVR